MIEGLTHYWLLCIFAIPAISACVAAIPFKNYALRNKALVILSFLGLASASLFCYDCLHLGDQFEVSLFPMLKNVNFAFKTTKHGLTFLFFVFLLHPISTLYTTSYLESTKAPNRAEFMMFFNIAFMSMFGLLLAENMLVMFIFYELITLSTYPLIIFSRNKESKSAGRYYLYYLVGASTALLFPAILAIYYLTGSLSFVHDGNLLANALQQGHITKLQVNILVMAVFFGCAKAAMFPFHKWLLKAMAAPTPVSAILHAVVVVKGGVFFIAMTLYSIFGKHFLEENLYSFQSHNIITYISVFTIIFASCVAFTHSHIKKRLAYSTIAQLSYVLLTLSLFTAHSFDVAIVQMIAHSFGKITLFFGAGAIYIINHNYDIRKITKLWHKSPSVSLAMLFGCLSIVGLPPAIGFYAKYYMLLNAMQDADLFVMFVIIVGSLLSAGYLMGILYPIFFVSEDDITKQTESDSKISFGIAASIISLCFIMVFLPFVFNII